MIKKMLLGLLGIVILALAGPAFGKSPTISSLSPTSGAVGASVTINGSNFGSTQGSSTVTFNGVQATVTSWKASTIAATVPAAATSGPVIVTVAGTASNSVNFTVTPVISSLSPTSGGAGTSVTIIGSGFGASEGSSTVSFNGMASAPTTWGAASIAAPVPSGARTGPVVVTVNGVSSNGVTFTVPPTLVSIAVIPQNSTLPLGLSEQFTATGTYSDGSTKDLTTVATWSSANTATATISNIGWATSRGAGTATITAAYGSVNASSVLTVTSPALISISIAPQSFFLPPGVTQQLTATGTYSDGSNNNITTSVTWASSNTAVVTITSGGVATGVSAGTATVTAATSTFVSGANVTVTSGGPPQITASVSPLPNAAGWNNTNVTVTFRCTPGSAPIATCPTPQTVSSEGANQTISGTVTDTVGNSATTSATVSIDKTSPTLTVTSPTEGAVVTTSTISSSGSSSDALSGVASLTCNGTPVTPTGSFSCNVTLNPGLNLLVVQAIDVAGNVSLIKLHVVLNAALPVPQSVQITPANVNLTVGSSQQFTALDEQGRLRADATWTVSNTHIATITTDSSPWLTALSSGSVTLTATAQGISGQTQVNVQSGSLSPGAAAWSVNPLPGLGTLGFVQAIPWNGATADLIDIEADSRGNPAALQGLTIDGQHVWGRMMSVGAVVPDAFGGLFSTSNAGLTDLDGETGQTVWQYSTTNTLSNFAVRPSDGAIFAIESNSQSPSVYLDVFDGGSGQRLLQVPLSQSYTDVQQEWHCTDSSGNPYVVFSDDGPGAGHAAFGPVVIDGNGNAYTEYGTIAKYDRYVYSDCQGTPLASSEIGTNTVALLQVGPDNSTSTQTVTSSSWSTFSSGAGAQQYSGSFSLNGFAVPDGQGGMLVAWTQQQNGGAAPGSSMITHRGTSGSNVFQLPLNNNLGGGPQQLVVGQNGTAFAMGTAAGPQPQPYNIVSFDMNAGTVNWTYAAPQNDTLSMIASSDGNGLAAKLTNTSNNPADTVIRFDSSGKITFDPWSANGIQNYGGSIWLGMEATLSAISAAPVMLSGSPWYAPDGNGGNAALQNISVTNFSQNVPNQTTTSNVLQKVEAALPSYSSCNNWLVGKTLTGLSEIQQLLQYNAFQHGTVNRGSMVYYENWAFSFGTNPDGSAVPGVPTGIAMTVNDVGGFYNTNSPLSRPYNGVPFELGPRHYGGKTLRAQAMTLIHEVAHLIEVPGFQPDYVNDNGRADNTNNKAVDANCRQLIEALR